MAPKKKDEQSEIVIHTVERGVLEFCVLGRSPLIMNRLSEKTKRQLLFPSGPKTQAEKTSTLKHEPLEEYRSSAYKIMDPKAPALLGVLATAFKGAMGTAALDLPDTTKARIGRLVYVTGELLQVFGTPRIFMASVRSADTAKTPDIRTRALLPEWGCRLRIEFSKPILREQSVANLLAAAGNGGIGDWRQSKGSGSYGAFELVSADNADFKRIVATQGRKAQQAALDNPVAHDAETSDLLSWFQADSKRRGFKAVA
jgi:hypothetical protein